MDIDHSKHGRGTIEDGPDDPFCICTPTEHRETCAASGCGFCLASLKINE